MHHFLAEMYTHVHTSATKWCIVGFVPQVYCKAVNVTLGICKRSIAKMPILLWVFATGLLQSCQCHPGYLHQVYCKAVNVTLGICNRFIAKLSMFPWVFATGLLQSCQYYPGYLQQVYCKAVNVTLGICNRPIAKLSMLPWAFPGAPLKVNGSPGNIQGNLTVLLSHTLLWGEGYSPHDGQNWLRSCEAYMRQH